MITEYQAKQLSEMFSLNTEQFQRTMKQVNSVLKDYNVAKEYIATFGVVFSLNGKFDGHDIGYLLAGVFDNYQDINTLIFVLKTEYEVSQRFTKHEYDFVAWEEFATELNKEYAERILPLIQSEYDYHEIYNEVAKFFRESKTEKQMKKLKEFLKLYATRTECEPIWSEVNVWFEPKYFSIFEEYFLEDTSWVRHNTEKHQRAYANLRELIGINIYHLFSKEYKYMEFVESLGGFYEWELRNMYRERFACLGKE